MRNALLILLVLGAACGDDTFTRPTPFGLNISYDPGTPEYVPEALDKAARMLFDELGAEIELRNVHVHFVNADTFECDGMEVYGCAFQWAAARVAARDACLGRTAFVHELARIVAYEHEGLWQTVLPDVYFDARNTVNNALIAACE